jgi:hypothetical protein
VQLRSARLCLNCEEVHDAQACPACASENYAYLTTWVPASKYLTRRPPRILAPTRIERIIFGSAVLGVAAFWLGRWSSRVRKELEEKATRDTGELR